MKDWTELGYQLDEELKTNLSELQKMLAIYERVGMTKHASELRKMIENADQPD